MKKIDQKIVSYKVVTPESKEALTAMANTILDETEELIAKLPSAVKLNRPLVCNSKTYRLKPPQAEHALYVTLSSIVHEGKLYPFEIFFNTKNPEHIEWTNALTLTISIAFRNAIETGTSLSSLIENLKETFGTKGSYLSKVPNKPKFVNGLVAEIGLVIEKFNNECMAWQPNLKLRDTGYILKNESDKVINTGWFLEPEAEATKVTNPCPECGEQLIKEAGCERCTECSYNKCG